MAAVAVRQMMAGAVTVGVTVAAEVMAVGAVVETERRFVEERTLHQEIS
jgi:hypothetical protein